MGSLNQLKRHFYFLYETIGFFLHNMSVSLSVSGQKKSDHPEHWLPLWSPLLGIQELQEMFQDPGISLLSHPFLSFKSSGPPSPFAQSATDSCSFNK